MIHRVHKLKSNSNCKQGQDMLILVHQLNLNHGFKINHLCEFGPLCMNKLHSHMICMFTLKLYTIFTQKLHVDSLIIGTCPFYFT